MRLSETRKLTVGDPIGTTNNDTLKYKYRLKKGVVLSAKPDEYNRIAVELTMNKKGDKEIGNFYPEWLCTVEEVDKRKNQDTLICPYCKAKGTLRVTRAVIEVRHIDFISENTGVEEGDFVETIENDFDKVFCTNCPVLWYTETGFLNDYKRLNRKAKK